MIVGTAGHIDHGKTSLVRLLTGVDTDRLKEEKARGITIDLGFAYLPVEGAGVLGFVDVPGHEKFVHNMLAGATGIDFLLLVVAADDGVMPQTREHLAIADLLGVRRGLVALTKCDLADEARRVAVVGEIRALLAGTGLAEADILPTSVVSGEGVDDLRAALVDAARETAARDGGGLFRLAVDRSFVMQGAGTVVTGTVLSGAMRLGDRLVVSPSGLAARVRAIRAQNQPAGIGRAGERCALNLAGDGVSKDAIHRGDIVLDAALHAPAARIDARLKLLASEAKTLAQWTPVRLHHAAAEVGARIVLIDDAPLTPGGEGLVQLVLDRPIAAASGDAFVLRDTTAQRTIGGGRFIDLRAPARKRRAPARRAQLAALALPDPRAALAALLAAPFASVDLAGFARDRAMAPETVEAIADALGLVRLQARGATHAFAGAEWARLKRAALATLDAWHQDNPDLAGMGLERLRVAVAVNVPAPLFAAALQRLARDGDVALNGAWARLAGHEARLTPRDESDWARIAPLLADAERFRPPRVRDIAQTLDISEPDVRRLMKLLGRMGRVDEVAHDHFFLRATVAEMAGIVRRLTEGAPTGQFTAAQFRDQVENGRKVAIQILEFFDRHGVTLRRGDLRRVNWRRLDLFAQSPDERASEQGREASPVGRPDFKSGRGRETVSGGFDSHSLPPDTTGAA
jgi:selenocysteine-specific elongation factor